LAPRQRLRSPTCARPSIPFSQRSPMERPLPARECSFAFAKAGPSPEAIAELSDIIDSAPASLEANGMSPTWAKLAADWHRASGFIVIGSASRVYVPFGCRPSRRPPSGHHVPFGFPRLPECSWSFFKSWIGNPGPSPRGMNLPAGARRWSGDTSPYIHGRPDNSAAISQPCGAT
jgi:hypothetical protein